MLYYHSVSGSGIDETNHSVGIDENNDLLKQKLDFCPTRWYTVVDEMSVDEVS